MLPGAADRLLGWCSPGSKGEACPVFTGPLETEVHGVQKNDAEINPCVKLHPLCNSAVLAYGGVGSGVLYPWFCTCF